MLEVRLIRTFDVKWDNKPVAISSRTAQSLFAYLLLNAGKSCRREKLAGMFWPEATEKKARAYLRHELWRLRKAFPSNELFRSDDIGIAFNSSVDYWLDTEVLENLADTVLAEELMVALSAYHGELLPGFYDEWITQRREHLQTVFEQKMAQLLELLENEKRWHEILEWAERCIRFGQGPEAAYRYLMIAYDALGDRNKVTSTYQRCVQELSQLDLEPSEQTRAIAFKRNAKLNIPIPLTSFIGREKELKEIADLLLKSRLVTLTGSGGIGKTRLAIQVVVDVLDRFPDGFWFLDLAPLSDQSLVPNTLANMLGLHESGGLPITNLLINYFRSRTTLIIFDNCEHLIESSSQLIHSLLTSCDGLSILATSRESLRVAGEISYRVPSLTIPKSDTQLAVSDLANMESVRLFTERAAFVSPGFVFNSQNAFDIVCICQRLDGIPLAIELAAARVNVLTVEQIFKRLDDRFNLLSRGLRSALPRHQTLGATIDWSYDLLSENEKLLFGRLAVFAGGWSLDAAEAVCTGQGEFSTIDVFELLTHLVDKSLIIVNESRYHMLETTRQYAQEKMLESKQSEWMHNQHLDFFLRLAEEAEAHLLSGGHQAIWLERLEIEQSNLRAALKWSLESNADAGIRLTGVLGLFWYMHAHFIEGRQWYDKALSMSMNVAPQTQIRLLIGAASNSFGRNEFERTEAFSKQCLILSRQQKNIWGIALALHHLGLVKTVRGDYKRARTLLNEGFELTIDMGNRDIENLFRADLANLSKAQGDYQQATAIYNERLTLSQEYEDRWGSTYDLTNLAEIAYKQGHYLRSQALLEQAIKLASEFRDKRLISSQLELMGLLAIHQRNLERATRLIAAAAALMESIGIAFMPEERGIMESIRAQLDEPRFEALVVEGNNLTIEQAIAFALDQCIS